MSYLHDASPQALDRLAVLIPAWQPEAQLLALTTSLLDQGFGNVIVVYDGRDARSTTP
jgi:hypothetical protein